MRVREARPTQPGPDPFKAMGIDWMTFQELTQAVPPVYAEFLGNQLC